jgi:hypothetical protein
MMQKYTSLIQVGNCTVYHKRLFSSGIVDKT